MGASPLRGYFMRLGRSPDDSTGDYAHMARRPVPRVLGHVRADVSDRKMGKASGNPANNYCVVNTPVSNNPAN